MPGMKRCFWASVPIARISGPAQFSPMVLGTKGVFWRAISALTMSW
jgi:hypothetical protein